MAGAANLELGPCSAVSKPVPGRNEVQLASQTGLTPHGPQPIFYEGVSSQAGVPVTTVDGACDDRAQDKGGSQLLGESQAEGEDEADKQLVGTLAPDTAAASAEGEEEEEEEGLEEGEGGDTTAEEEDRATTSARNEIEEMELAEEVEIQAPRAVGGDLWETGAAEAPVAVNEEETEGTVGMEDLPDNVVAFLSKINK